MLEVNISCIVLFSALNLILGGLAYVWHNRQKRIGIYFCLEGGL